MKSQTIPTAKRRSRRDAEILSVFETLNIATQEQRMSFVSTSKSFPTTNFPEHEIEFEVTSTTRPKSETENAKLE